MSDFFERLKEMYVSGEELPSKEWKILRLVLDGKEYHFDGVNYVTSYFTEYGGGTQGFADTDFTKTKILSVKRLSDGEVFSVGDELNWGVIEKFDFEKNELVAFMPPLFSSTKNEPYPYNKTRRKIKDLQKLRPATPTFQWTDELVKQYGTETWLDGTDRKEPMTIEHFKDGVMVGREKGMAASGSIKAGEGYANGVLNTDEKRMGGKKFLFISDDDVEIFEGDKVWWVDKRLNKIDDIYSASPLEPPHFTNPKRDCQPNETWGMFKWLLNAHKYIDQQKPKPQNNKERIEVKEFSFMAGGTREEVGLGASNKITTESTYKFSLNKYLSIPDEKKVKQAVEQVLNGDNEKFWERIAAMTDEAIDEVTKHKYTEEDLKKAFNASREKNITGDEYDERGVPKLKYKTFEDYKNKL